MTLSALQSTVQSERGLLHETRSMTVAQQLERAAECFGQGQHKEALACCESVLKMDPRCEPAYGLLGQFLSRHEQTAAAHHVLTQGVLNCPHSMDLRSMLVQVLLDAKALPEAEVHAVEVMVRQPDDPNAHALLARVRRYQGQLPEAVDGARRALKLALAGPPQAQASDAGRLSAFETPNGFENGAHETLLWRTLVQLRQAKVHAVPTAGSLLGLVREGHLLTFDKDTDVALPFSQMPAAIACLRANGWKEHRRSHGLSNPRAFRHRQSGMVLDLCGLIPARDGDGLWGGFWMAGLPDEWQRFTRCPVVPLTRRETEFGPVWWLSEPERWLEALYGPDWRVPDPLFDTVIAAHNLVGFSPMTQYYAFSRIHAHSWLKGRMDKALATVRHALRHLPGDSLLLEAEALLTGTATDTTLTPTEEPA